MGRKPSESKRKYTFKEKPIKEEKVEKNAEVLDVDVNNPIESVENAESGTVLTQEDVAKEDTVVAEEPKDVDNTNNVKVNNNLRIDSSMFGYFWNGQEIDL